MIDAETAVLPQREAETAAHTSQSIRQIAIVGGGLAGLAAAARLIEGAGKERLRVTLFESLARLGGRAGCMLDSRMNRFLDQCPHVTMGCCTAALDFFRRTEIAESLVRHDVWHFYGPDGWRYDLRPARWLPPRWKLLPGLMRLRYLSRGDRLAVVRSLAALVKSHDRDMTIGQWLERRGASVRACRLFWQVIVESALSEDLQHASLAAVRQVVAQGFLGGAEASAMYVARRPLGWLLARLDRWLRARNVALRLRTPVTEIRPVGQQVELTPGKAEVERFDAVILAIPWDAAGGLLAPLLPAPPPWQNLAAAPITAVNLWFDRPLKVPPHGVLPGCLAQWYFRAESMSADAPGDADPPAEAGDPPPALLQVVISASRHLRERPHDAIAAEVHRELSEILPALAAARLVHHRIFTHQRAVFSPRPGVGSVRPGPHSGIPGILLAGDWTATGWPATMESAIRSGYRAAAICLAGDERRLAPAE